MIKGKTPSLISGSSGKPKFVEALKKSQCKRCGFPIAKGQKCVDVPNPRASFSSSRRFCPDCFGSILKQTKIDLNAIESDAEQGGGSVSSA